MPESDDEVLVQAAMRDLAKIGLPLQIGGAAAAAVGFAIGLGINLFAGLWMMGAGLAVHIVGDTFFYFQMKRQGCI